MDYEKKLKEALNSNDTSFNVKCWIKNHFPELKESEDERIREKIITIIHLYYGEPLENEAKEMIAWLEKQGEQKPADNIEPKFKVGDWIIDIQGVAFNRIINSDGESYQIKTCCSNFWLPIHITEKNYRLWTIQDAKDGDVLATEDWVFIFKELNAYGKPICYCHYDDELGFKVDVNSYMATGSKIYPSTKEQRDLLFQKMKEARYTFDFEKKELKKIEQKPAEWSEEDENLLKLSLENLAEQKDRFGEKYGKVGDCIDWLKSIKDRVQPKQEWKPSVEQMISFNYIIKSTEEKWTKRIKL